MKVISFFSFKGGVGRTALLVNLAMQWATEGRVVALMDLDLSAPGLSYSPLLRDADYLDPRGRGLGMADLLNAFRDDQVRTVGGAPEQIALLPPHLLLRSVPLPQGKVTTGRVLVIDAGSGAYTQPVPQDGASLMEAIPAPQGRPDEDPGQTAFRALARHLRQDLAQWRIPAGQPGAGRAIDLLLVDARTGFNELVDLSLGYLADRMVLVSGLNDQNLRGLRLTIEALQRERIPIGAFPLHLTLVLSPVPAGEDAAVLAALERAHRELGESMRLDSYGRREAVPPSFSLHYTPLLAISDQPVLLDYPKALYAREVRAIAHDLDGIQATDDLQDYLLAEARHRALRLLPQAPVEESLEPRDEIAPDRPALAPAANPYTNLPPWDWPFDLPAEQKARDAWLAERTVAPGIELDLPRFLDLLAWSTSLDTAGKRRIIDVFPSLSQFQFNELLKIFDEERGQFRRLWVDPQSRTSVAKLLPERAEAWAEIVLPEPSLAKSRLAGLLSQTPPRLDLGDEPEPRLVIARERLATGDLEQAAVALDQAVRVAPPPHDPGDGLLAGIERPAPDLVERAVALFQAQFPDDPWWRFHRARWVMQDGPSAPDLALEWLAPLLDTPPERADRCFALGAFVLNHLPAAGARAEAALRRACDQAPDNARHWNSLGNLLRKHLGRYDEAESAYRKAVEIDPKFPDPWNNLGVLFADRLGRYDEAESAYRKAAEIDPKFAYAWNNLGILLSDYLGRYDEAAFAYRKAAAIDSKFARPWNGLGNLLSNHLGRYDEAESAYRKAAAIDPKYARPWIGLGVLLWLDGRAEDAAVAYERGMALPDEAAAPYLAANLGHLRLQQCRTDEALALLAQALAGLSAGDDKYGNGLRLALSLDQSEAVATERQRLRARLDPGEPTYPFGLALLLDALVGGDGAEPLEPARARALAALDSHHVHYDLIEAIYRLCGLRPEAREQGRPLVADLLTMPPSLTERFKDQPKPAAVLDRFRPFAAGESDGAGDPRDRERFCTPLGLLSNRSP